jgi:hypothetical protein
MVIVLLELSLREGLGHILDTIQILEAIRVNHIEVTAVQWLVYQLFPDK